MLLWGHVLVAYSIQDNALKYIWRHSNEDGQRNIFAWRVGCIHWLYQNLADYILKPTKISGGFDRSKISWEHILVSCVTLQIMTAGSVLLAIFVLTDFPTLQGNKGTLEKLIPKTWVFPMTTLQWCTMARKLFAEISFQRSKQPLGLLLRSRKKLLLCSGSDFCCYFKIECVDIIKDEHTSFVSRITGKQELIWIETKHRTFSSNVLFPLAKGLWHRCGLKSNLLNHWSKPVLKFKLFCKHSNSWS